MEAIIIDSEQSQPYFHKTFCYWISIYRGAETKGWLLEVIAPDDSSFVWDDLFTTEEDALAEGLRAIREDDALQPKMDREIGLDTPLTINEQADLNHFLFDRLLENQWHDEEFDSGIDSLSALDGFLTGIVARPELHSSEQWLPILWGVEEPNWDDFSKKRILSMIHRHKNSIALMLNETPEQYKPIFIEDEGSIFTYDVDEWCEGYLRTIALNQSMWLDDTNAVREEFLLITLFGSSDGLPDLVRLPNEVVQEKIDRLPDAIKRIHRHYYELRTGEKMPHSTSATTSTLPLTVDQLDQLDRLLELRIPDSDDIDSDEGIIDSSELDGYLTAVLSAREMIPAQVWMDGLWGEYPPEPDEIEEMSGLIIQHYNALAEILMNEPEIFPLFRVNKDPNGDIVESAAEWCYGYMRGVNLAPEQFVIRDENEVFDEYMGLMQLFGTDERLNELLELSTKEVLLKQALVPHAAQYIFSTLRGVDQIYEAPDEYFREDYFREDYSVTTVVRDTPKVGRNDPCPCGSGKKFKKCCLH